MSKGSLVYEKAVIIKIFHNQELQKYLPAILPGIFSDEILRCIAYTMQYLQENNTAITVENIVTVQRNTKIKRFKRKHRVSKHIDSDLVGNILYDIEVDSTPSLFEDAFKELYDLAFARYVEQANEDFRFELGYRNRDAIVSRAKSIVKLYELLFKKKLEFNEYSDNIEAAAIRINKGDSYLRTSLRTLNSLIGGTSKGFITTLLARPSHGKSTFMTHEIRHKIRNNLVGRVDVISPEEPQDVFWRRIFAAELNIPLYRMRDGTVKLSHNDIKKIKEIYGGKVFFHNLINLRDIIDLIFSVKSPYLVIDHINAVGYPKGDMFNGIVTLVNRENQFLKENPDSVIINLSQVNTKEMLRKGRLRPRKEDMYGNSILEQASREIISMYYPYKDAVSPETQKYMLGTGEKYRKDRVELLIEKSSFSDVGSITIGYSHDTAVFYDLDKQQVYNSGNVVLPDENFQEKLL